MEGKSLYRPVLKQAWAITKNFKSLWFFGLFVALLGAGGEYEILMRAFTNKAAKPGILAETISSFQAGIADGLAMGGTLLSNLGQVMTSNPQVLVALLFTFVISLAFTVFFIWLAITSQIGIIKNVSEIGKNKKPIINEGIDFSVSKFWPIFSINLVYKIILMLLFFILSKEVFLLLSKNTTLLVVYLISFIIFMTIIFIISFVIKYQIFYMLLKQQTLVQALKSGWELFKKNWLISLEMSFILFVVFSIGASVIWALFTFLMPLPIVWGFWYKWSLVSVSIVMLILLIVLVLLSAWVITLISTFQWTAWTILFEKLVGRDTTISKIIRGGEMLRRK